MRAAARSLPALLVALAGSACFDVGSEPWSPETSEQDQTGADRTPSGDAGPVDPDGDDDGHAHGLTCPREPPKDVHVEMVRTTFQPALVVICTGDSVTWENRDTKEHTIYTGLPERPDGVIASDKLYFGDTFTWTFDEPGEYVYYCSTHKKKMRDALVRVLQ